MNHNISITYIFYTFAINSNTVGHFDAYIIKPIRKQQFQLKLIDANSYENVEFYREDANILSKKI